MLDIGSAEKTGVLVLVVGPSGAGKDTLIDAAKEHFRDNSRVLFPQRLITRQEKIGEDHIPVTPEEFEKRLKNSELFLSWEAHGLQYGVLNEVKTKLEQGHLIILNISRRQVSEARSLWKNTVVVQIVVDQDILIQRLKKRGRENIEEIEVRFARRDELVSDEADHIIDNSGELVQAIDAFVKIIERYLKHN